MPWTRRFEYVKEFKQAHRRDDDIAIVNAGLRLRLAQSAGVWARACAWPRVRLASLLACTCAWRSPRVCGRVRSKAVQGGTLLARRAHCCPAALCLMCPG